MIPTVESVAVLNAKMEWLVASIDDLRIDLQEFIVLPGKEKRARLTVIVASLIGGLATGIIGALITLILSHHGG